MPSGDLTGDLEVRPRGLLGPDTALDRPLRGRRGGGEPRGPGAGLQVGGDLGVRVEVGAPEVDAGQRRR